MARVCQVTGKKPMVGNNISHAHNKTKRRFLPNLQNRKFWVESENRWVSMRITNAALRTIDKNGIDAVLAEMRAAGEKIKVDYYARKNQTRIKCWYWSFLYHY